ncbi:MAG TPA: hypothetical protein PK955_01765 [Methanoregulaceae archaeon]|nr:hypothetical protein [Methanoregulaceae archaeon]
MKRDTVSEKGIRSEKSDSNWEDPGFSSLHKETCAGDRTLFLQKLSGIRSSPDPFQQYDREFA